MFQSVPRIFCKPDPIHINSDLTNGANSSVVWPLGVVVASVLYLTFGFFFPPLIEKKDGQATFTSRHDSLADEKDEKENSATVHIQGV